MQGAPAFPSPFIEILGLTLFQIQTEPTGYMRVVRQLILAYGMSGAIRYLKRERKYRMIYGHPNMNEYSHQYSDQDITAMIARLAAVWFLSMTTARTVKRLLFVNQNHPGTLSFM